MLGMQQKGMEKVGRYLRAEGNKEERSRERVKSF